MTRNEINLERDAWADELAVAVEMAVANRIATLDPAVLEAVGPDNVIPALVAAIGEHTMVKAALARAHRWAVADHFHRKEAEK